jgi:hypothetical protein
LIGEIAAYTTYLVRLGVHAQIARLQCDLDSKFERGAIIVCRTNRGTELGEVLAEASFIAEPKVAIQCDGMIVRQAAAEELYLQQELKKLAEAFLPEASEEILSRGSAAVLLEVEPMLDCQTVYFHFLGGLPESSQAIMDELALRFQGVVQSSRLAELLDKGCGPGCGTKDRGCNSTGCKGCAVAQACGTKPRD